MITNQEFNRLNDALMTALAYGAKRVAFDNPGICLDFDETATWGIHLNENGKWLLQPIFYIAEGYIDLQPDPVMALARAMANARVTNKAYDEIIISPRSLAVESGIQFHLSASRNRYESADTTFMTCDDIWKYFRLSPEDQHCFSVPKITIRSWVGDSFVNWKNCSNTQRQVDQRLHFYNLEQGSRYTGLINVYGEIKIETSSNHPRSRWALGDILLPSEVNQYESIKAEAEAFSTALEIGIKVTHRETHSNSGQFLPVLKDGN
jgi:hypothetical protein